MSYEIEVISQSQNHVVSMNWQRNPFGLCSFAEDNVGTGDRALWHVCNDHAYDSVDQIDRRAFLAVVRSYNERVQALDDARFHFGFMSYVQFAVRYPDAMLMDEPLGWWRRSDNACSLLTIPIERFATERDFSWGDVTVLDYYKRRFDALVSVGEAMQDLTSTIVIEN